MASEWEELYQAAVLETDWAKKEVRIQAAESVISAKLQQFSTNHGTPQENQLKEALNGLSALRREVTDWKSKAVPGVTCREMD
jgi:hypothetical protein